MRISRHGVYLGFSVVLLSLVFVVSGCRASEAQYPTKPVSMVVYVAAGGALDIYAREAAKLAEKPMGVSMPVENRTGGSGAVAITYMKGQPADGYIVGAATKSLLYVLANPDLSVSVDDLDWVIRQEGEPVIIGVAADSQFKTLDDVIAYAKAHPGEFKAGGTSTGSLYDHFLFNFSNLAGIKTEWVAFNSANEAAVAALGGHISAYLASPSSALGLVKDGKIRLLAVATDKRLDYLPDVPTFKEKGFNLVESNWRGMYVKKGTPAPIIKKLHDSFKQIEDTQEWKDHMKNNWQTDLYLGSEDFNKSVAKESEDIKTFLKQIGRIK